MVPGNRNVPGKVEGQGGREGERGGGEWMREREVREGEGE